MTMKGMSSMKIKHCVLPIAVCLMLTGCGSKDKGKADPPATEKTATIKKTAETTPETEKEIPAYVKTAGSEVSVETDLNTEVESVLESNISSGTEGLIETELSTEETEEIFRGEIVGNIPVSGTIYTFDDKSHYEYASSENGQETVFGNNTYGYFSISGSVVSEGEKDGFKAYGIDGGDVVLFYTYGNALLNADDESWHLVNDGGKSVNEVKLKSKINKGALILQTSQDGKTWIDDVVCMTNIFDETPVQEEPFYTTRDVQLVNGCYYRLILAYETGIKSGESQVLFVKLDEHEYRKYAEVYEFYLYDVNSDEKVDTSKKMQVGKLIKTGTNNGYSGSKEIKSGDPHYGWQLGNFFVSGYTREMENDDGAPVFLKNVGDQVTLWFNLKQNIDRLNNDNDLSITTDTANDQYFQTPTFDMGRGTLIIRYTDEQRVAHEPEIYTNYLEANASMTADTIVKLFEEGDYEVSLDYEVRSVPRKIGSLEVIPEYTDYKIFYTFSVRNGNCMVFPFDVSTRAELTNRAVTENGFYLDLARSRYLDINVKRSTITEGVDGLTEDVRFNRPAKDGEEYKEPGLYTITVNNLYTGESTVKEIFVGSDKLLEQYLQQGVSMEDLMG